MSLVLEHPKVYAFLGGVFVGKFTGWFPTLLISGITLYYFNPEIYSYETIKLLKTHGITLVNMIKQ